MAEQAGLEWALGCFALIPWGQPARLPYLGTSSGIKDAFSQGCGTHRRRGHSRHPAPRHQFRLQGQGLVLKAFVFSVLGF